jgi:hypothetical protein
MLMTSLVVAVNPKVRVILNGVRFLNWIDCLSIDYGCLVDRCGKNKPNFCFFVILEVAAFVNMLLQKVFIGSSEISFIR